MRLKHGQRGITMWGWLYIFVTLGTFGMAGMKSFPVYMNQMALTKAVHQVAADRSLGDKPATEVRRSLQRYWDIGDIHGVDPQGIKIKKTATGRAMEYAYDSTVPLFYNISLGFHFEESVPMAGGNGGSF